MLTSLLSVLSQNICAGETVNGIQMAKSYPQCGTMSEYYQNVEQFSLNMFNGALNTDHLNSGFYGVTLVDMSTTW